MGNEKAQILRDDVYKIYRCEQCGRCSSACPITGVGDFNIRKLIRSIELLNVDDLEKKTVVWECLTCGRCEEACPNGVSVLGIVRYMRRFVSKFFSPSSVPSCVEACPAGIDIPCFIRMISVGDLASAYDLIMQKVPLPGVLGRVCNKPCEIQCRRSKLDEPISICNLKRYVSDSFNGSLVEAYRPGIDTGKRVLIVGSGPAGLSAAYYLRRKGHNVVMIESREKIGGMLYYGIPSYRLPKRVLLDEINRIIEMGVDVRTCVKLDSISKVDDLGCLNFDAIFIAIGMQLGRWMEINNNDCVDIFLGLDFLIELNKKEFFNIKRDVCVVGGGSVAIDVAMSAIRLGAKNVFIVCLEKREEMPADDSEIVNVLNEGVKIINSYGINRIVVKDKKLIGIDIIECESIFDVSGKFNPKFNDNVVFVNVDQIFFSVGQEIEMKTVDDLSAYVGNDIVVEGSHLVVDSNSRILKSTNVFAGGDITGVSQSVVNAVASGRRNAIFIDEMFGHDGGHLLKDSQSEITDNYFGDRVDGFSYFKRQISKKIPIAERKKGFIEFKCGLDKNQAKFEADRCLQCDCEFCLVIN